MFSHQEAQLGKKFYAFTTIQVITTTQKTDSKNIKMET